MLELSRSTPKSSAIAQRCTLERSPIKKKAMTDVSYLKENSQNIPLTSFTPAMTSSKSKEKKLEQKLSRSPARISWSASQSALAIDRKVIASLFDDKLKEIKANNLEAVKISRYDFPNLRNSYIILKDGTIFRYFHKSGKKSEAVHDKSEGMVGEGGVKVVKKMYNLKGNISYVIGILKSGFSEKVIKEVIAVQLEIAEEFRKAPFLMPGKYIEWKNHSGQIKRGFLTPKMDTFDTEISPDDVFSEVIPALPAHFTFLQGIHLFCDVAQGLKALHDKDWAHLDIKPSNIFLKHMQACLGDFDFARRLNESSLIPRIGTPVYMAPELLEGTCKGKIGGKRADIYSLGISYEELLLRMHFHIDSQSGLDMEDMRVFHEIKAVTDRMCSIDPEKRPTIDEVIDMLRVIIQNI